MGVRVTADQAQAKWVNRLSGATTEIANGVDRVTQAPGTAAAAKSAKWEQNVLAAKDKWKARVASVTLDEWKSAMKEVGVPRVAQGAQAKQAKFGKFASEFFPHLERGLTTIDRMPDTTFEERVQKSIAMMRHNHSFKRSGS